LGRLMGLTAISYGGGVQSTALVVLAATGQLPFKVDAALFANVGDDSEHPATLDYVRNVAIPWAAERGLAVHELTKSKRNGEQARGLWSHIMEHDDPDTLREPIPVRGMNGAPLSRSCTVDWKVKVVGKWLKAHGASKDDPATVCIGISTDEITRVSNKRVEPYERPIYPLIDLGLDRSACQRVIAEAGLPVPGKSSCFFCPFHRPQMWAEMRRDEPDLFFKAADLEATLIARRTARGKDPVYLTRFGVPLTLAVSEAQDMLPGFAPDMETCDNGYCWT
jgi:hypothetical protein